MMYWFKMPQPGRGYYHGRYTPHLPRITAKFRVRITNRGHRVVEYMHQWEKQFLFRSGAAIRTYAINAFKVVKNRNKKSNVGTPPHLHMPKSAFIRSAIQFKVNLPTQSVAIGPAYSVAKLWGWKHEHGKMYGRSRGIPTKFPLRPFMAPAFR